MSDTECNCELRNRAWNPNTGKCETCKCRYSAPRTMTDCVDCKNGVRRFLDTPTSLWLHDRKVEGGSQVCADQRGALEAADASRMRQLLGEIDNEIDSAKAAKLPHVARYRIIAGPAGAGYPTVVGCTCGFDCTTQNPDDEMVQHLSLMNITRGSPAMEIEIARVTAEREESEGDRAVRALKLQWAREVSAPRPTTMPSLPVRLGVIHDELLRAALAWAQADRASDLAADQAETAYTALDAHGKLYNPTGRDDAPAFDDAAITERKRLKHEHSHAETRYDIAGVAEQKADEALRAIAKRLLAELGL